MKMATLETRNFTFTAFASTQTEVMQLMRKACRKHAKDYECDYSYFRDLIGADDNEKGNVAIIDIECGHAYRDHEEIVS